MLSSFNNPWFTVAADPLSAWRQAAEAAARCLDADLRAEPNGQRLNPFDFHGRRRPDRLVSGAEGHVAMSRSRRLRRAC